MVVDIPVNCCVRLLHLVPILCFHILEITDSCVKCHILRKSKNISLDLYFQQHPVHSKVNDLYKIILMFCSGLRNSIWSVSLWFSLRNCQYLRIEKRASKFKSRNVRTVQYYGAFMQPLLQWKSMNVTYSDCIFICSFS